MSRVRAANGDNERSVFAAFAKSDWFWRSGIGDDRFPSFLDDVPPVIMATQRERCAGIEDFRRRKGRRGAFPRWAAVFVAPMDECDACSRAVEASVGEWPTRLGRRVTEAVQRDLVVERERRPRRLGENADIRRFVIPSVERVGGVWIVIAGRDEDRLRETRELFVDETCRPRAGALRLEQVAADREHIGFARQGEVDDSREGVGEGGTAAAAAADVGEDRFEMDVCGMDDGQHGITRGTLETRPKS
jgi:hypothetical protein